MFMLGEAAVSSWRASPIKFATSSSSGLGTSDSASTALSLAIAIAREHQHGTLPLVITLYARLAPILWPCITAERLARLPKSEEFEDRTEGTVIPWLGRAETAWSARCRLSLRAVDPSLRWTSRDSEKLWPFGGLPRCCLNAKRADPHREESARIHWSG
jgi:hypothetical protein